MIELNLMREMTTNKVWSMLMSNGYLKKEATQWVCERFSNDRFEEAKKSGSSLNKSILIQADGPKLIQLQEDLKQDGVMCSTEILINGLPENWSFNVMVIWCRH